MDIVDPDTRSRMMSGIRSKNTKPEVLVRSLLHRKGFRFKLHNSTLPGKPDIVLPKYSAIIFVHGCFWHGHGCHLFRMPSTRTEFWKKKIEQNQSNDQRTLASLKAMGWRVAVIWECAVKGRKKQEKSALLTSISTWLQGNELMFIIPTDIEE